MAIIDILYVMICRILRPSYICRVKKNHLYHYCSANITHYCTKFIRPVEG